MKTPSKKTVSTAQIIAVVALYISFQIFSDILAIKVASLFGIAFTVGTIIYPFTFTLRDMVHKILGKKGARQVVIWAGVLNLLMVGLFQLAILLPPDSHWGIQNEFSIVLGSVWRIVVASILAEIISQLIDTEAYSFYVNKITKKYQWGRVLFSNFFASPVDSMVFVFVAFLGILPMSVLWTMIGVQIVVKWLMAIISIPGIYLVKDKEEVKM
jgi:uncharacterized integral membrane protein (TIGR00697 family)